MNYVGIDKKFIEKTVETEGSRKIGMIIPGTEILITPESQLYQDQPDYALLFSWHIADELMKIIKFKGFKGDFILPLPETRIISNSQIPSL